MEKISVAGLKIDAITKKEFLAKTEERLLSGQKTFAITPYSEFLYYSFQNPKLLEIFNQADFAVADGIGIFWAKKYLEIPLTAKNFWLKIFQSLWQIIYSLAAIIFYPSWIKSALPEKIVGADLIWDLAELAAKNKQSIYLLGGLDNTPELAVKKLISKFPNIIISGHSNKNFTDLTILNDINNLKPDILLVAFGPVKQEKWIAENLPKLDVKLAIGLGGTFDYLAGKRLSPPKIMRYGGLEWLYRLFTQPKRYKRIYNATVGLISGLWHYKVFSDLPLRRNVVMVILNKKNEVLICERSLMDFYVDIASSQAELKKLNYWQLPQGGIEEKENLEQAAKREASEETGIKNLEFIKTSAQTNTYIWNNALRKFRFNRGYRNKGQIQNIAYFKFHGNDNEIKVDDYEFINFKWVSIAGLVESVHEERSNVAKIVREDLKDLA